MTGTNELGKVMPELAAFVRVVDAGSFTAAAAGLGMSPSALSRRVSRLERLLGVQLLRRTTRQLAVTEAGLATLERAREMLSAAQAAMDVAVGHMTQPQGVVRLSAPKAFARHVLHPHLMAFLARYPQIHVQLRVEDPPMDLLRDALDLGVQLTRQPPEGLVARALMPVRQVLVASADYLAGAPPIHAPQDLTQHSCLFLGERARDNQWRFVRGEQLAEVTVQGRYAANHSGLRLDAALQGLGIAQLPDFAARDALRSGALQQVLRDWDLEASYAGTAYLLFPPNRHLPPKVRVLVDFLVEAYGAADPDWADAPARGNLRRSINRA